MLNKTHDPAVKSWIPVPDNSDFPIQNLPFGIISKPFCPPRVASRIGDTIIDLAVLAREGYLRNLDFATLDSFEHRYLNKFISRGKDTWSSVRKRLFELFSAENGELRDQPEDCKKILIPLSEAENLMPVRVGDYTDFYSSIEHATNVGMMFRDPQNALLPNWKHLPVAYHGRSSSIVISGARIPRPHGQILTPGKDEPVFSPSKNMDFELEVAFVVGKDNGLGEKVTTPEAENHIFGLVLFNDLSARDIQRWEYVPLGPFLSKNFGSVISPWLVTMEALEPFRVAGPVQDTPVLPYLQTEGDRNFDISLEVFIKPQDADEHMVSRSNFKYLYWNMAQQLAHHTINGCNLRVGDMCASGTISGPDPGSYGSLLELTWNGKQVLEFPDGTTRTFLQDYDTVTIRGYSEKNGLRIGFGESVTQIIPAKP